MWCTQPFHRPTGKTGGAVRRAGESRIWLEPRCPWGPCCQGCNDNPTTPACGPVTEKKTSRNEVTTTRKAAPTVTVGPKQAPGPSWTNPRSLNSLRNPRNWWPHSPIEESPDLFDNLQLNAFVEITRRLLTSIPSLPSGPARSRALLKMVTLFVAEYGSTA